MERVAFLIPGNEPPLTCLLNPESLTQRRTAGVQQRRAASGPLTGAGLSDDPLLFTGGGRTELDLDLLFDVSLSETPVEGEDVRTLTRRLWNLAENTERDGNRAQLQVVRFMWGKSWNIPGVVVSVAERLEYFDADGVPRRSWMRLRMLRVSEDTGSEGATRPVRVAELPTVTQEGLEQASMHQTAGGTSDPEDALPGSAVDGVSLTAENLIDQVLAETTVDAQLESAWRDLANAGRIIDELLASLAREADEAEEDQESADAGSFADPAVGADETVSPDVRAPAAAQELRAGMDQVLNVQAQVASAPRSRLVGTLTLAGATLSAGLERMRGAADSLLEQASAESVASQDPGMPTGRQRLSMALHRVGSAARRVRDADKRAAVAIKVRAVAMIAIATQHIRAVAQGLDVLATRALAAGAATSADAWEMVRGVADEIGQTTRSVYEAGKVFDAEELGPAVGRLAVAANRLWLEGQVAAAREISRAAQDLSLAMYRVRVGAEAMAFAACSTTAATLVERAAEHIRATLQELRAGREDQAALSVRQALAAMAAVAETTDVEDSAVEQVNAARAWVQEPGALDQPHTAERVLEALAEIVEMVRARVAREAGVDAQAIAAAAAAGKAVAPVARDRATAGIGDRLDQLAYRYYRDPALWRLLAVVNDIDHPLRVRSGSLLRIPPALALRTRTEP